MSLYVMMSVEYEPICNDVLNMSLYVMTLNMSLCVMTC